MNFDFYMLDGFVPVRFGTILRRVHAAVVYGDLAVMGLTAFSPERVCLTFQAQAHWAFEDHEHGRRKLPESEL
jgi:hypothetical protein